MEPALRLSGKVGIKWGASLLKLQCGQSVCVGYDMVA